MTTNAPSASSGRSLAPRLPDAPLVSADQAKTMWDEYQKLEEALLTDDDYLWFLEVVEVGRDGRRRVRRFTHSTKEEAEADQRHKGGTLRKRKVKSACRKLAKFFGYEIPDQGMGQVETLHDGPWTIAVERGEGYCHMEWLDEHLRTVKASTTVFIRAPAGGRTWAGRGGAHGSENFSDDFAIGQTAFTRAVNRAVLDAVGFGDESADEVPGEETLPGSEVRKPQGTESRSDRRGEGQRPQPTTGHKA